jgi:hypothetical protein
MHLLPSANLETLADTYSCDPKSKVCMYGMCQVCATKTPQLLCDYNGDMTVSYFQWIPSTEMKTNKNGQTVSVKLTRKETVESPLQNMINEFNKQIARFNKHLITIRHQHAQYRHLKGTLATNESMIQIDFSENSMLLKFIVYFGASHAQATLHNGVLYQF